MPHQITIKPSNHVFTVREDETILEAALRAGIGLPYGCRNGACGACKGILRAGELVYGDYQERALHDSERAAGKALTCCTRPLSDVVFEVRELAGAKDVAIRTLPCRVEKVEKPAEDVAILSLKLPAGERLQFLAGQYIDILMKDGKRRSFSMANAPHDAELLQLHVRHVAGGQFTDHVFGKMKERDILRFEGPLGTFFLREDSDKPIVFVASGTGFAPIKAMIEHMLEKGIARPATLYWGGRRPKDLYLHALAEGWAAQGSLKYVPVISDALPEDNWTGRTGFVHRAVLEDFPDLSGFQVYACGAPIVIDSARTEYSALAKLPPDEFHADSFTTEADKHGA